MPTTYTRKLLNAMSKTQEASEFRSFVKTIGHQLRAPFRSKFNHTKALQILQETYDLIQQTSPQQILCHLQSSPKGSILYVNMADQPFIVDTLRIHLVQAGAFNISGYNAVLAIHRDEQGNIIKVNTPSGIQEPLESVLRFELEGIEEESLAALQTLLHERLQLARKTVHDFTVMIDVIERVKSRLTRQSERIPDQLHKYVESANFLNWLLADNFVFMGLAFSDESYGILHPEMKKFWNAPPVTSWEPQTKEFPIVVRKGSMESPIHRGGQVDEIYIAVPGAQGKSNQKLYIQGLFTHRAVNQSSRQVPLLREVLAQILRKDKSQPGTYRYKGICNVFDSLPTEFLFTTSAKELSNLIDRVLEAEQEQKARVNVIQDDGAAFVLTAIPRVLWSDKLRKELQQILMSKTGASYCDYGVFAGRYQTMLIHFFLTGTTSLSSSKHKALEAELVHKCTPWNTRLVTALQHITQDSSTAEALGRKFGEAFQEAFVQRRPIHEAAHDVLMLANVEQQQQPLARLFIVEQPQRAYLRIYQADNLLLSDMLPVIDNFGLRVLDQFADPVQTRHSKALTIDTFRLESVDNLSLQEFEKRAALLCRGLEAVLSHKITSDSFNKLVLRANIPWEAADLFRGLYGYATQLGLPFSVEQSTAILLTFPDLIHQLWEFFAAKFDPKLADNRTANINRCREQTEDSIRKLNTIAQDQVFRTFHNLIDSLLRSNFYRSDRIEHYLSFKIDCQHVQNMPLPKMQYEIYVHHIAMEGLHLRGGKIARGGIRWSDRSDFRREVLDLVATQMVKNVLIVPEGAKGGFRIKKQITDRKIRRQRADELYQILIRGMLDLTDNLIDGKVVTPQEIVRMDGDDPYLVVAADKGTAHLSDTANSLSQAYGFWLGDAFASGGSNGYDHKKVGITARGGWMTTKRHFLELGIDPSKQEFTAIGIGDPAGDVFGNGVVYLEQKERPNNKMKLVGAFNHMHIFLDPNPNPETSYQERLRLFRAVKGWGDYDTKAISTGGGVFSRSAKSIPLSPEVQNMLGVLKDELSPEVVIRLMLRLNVDLIWNGGIGTYVKSSDESQFDAGDPGNDHLRINADELRARIVGEGGNLGFTQNGRVEYALHSGRLNTDAIDNSGGVDMSDHEVNLKILLNPLVQSKDLAIERRNEILESMTEEVAQMVLYNNDTHAKQLSLDKLRSEEDPMRFASTIQWVCQQGDTTRQDLCLPNDDELLRRHKLGQGLTRPELAVLAAHVKMHVFKRLKSADTTVIPQFGQWVENYFPQRIKQNYSQQIASHMLFQSIGMTTILNEVVGDAGAWLFPGIMDITGAKVEEVIRAWLIALETIDAKALRQEITETSPHPTAAYSAWVAALKPLYSLITLWLFSPHGLPNTERMTKIRKALTLISRSKGSVHRDRIEKSQEELKTKDVPDILAHKIALFEEISIANEIAILTEQGMSMNNAVVCYYGIGEASNFLPMIRNLENRQSTGGWDPAANAILQNRFFHLLRKLIDSIDLDREVKLGIDRVALRLSRYNLKDLRNEMEDILGGTTDLASLMVANARAQARIKREFSATNQILGTGVHE